MFITINNMKQLNEFLQAAGITRPEKIKSVLSDKNILVSPNVAKLILKAA